MVVLVSRSLHFCCFCFKLVQYSKRSRVFVLHFWGLCFFIFFVFFVLIFFGPPRNLPRSSDWQKSLSASEAGSFNSGLHVIALPPTRHAHVRVGAPFRKSHREIYRQPIGKDKENSADERFPRQCAMPISSSKQDCVLQQCVLLE